MSLRGSYAWYSKDNTITAIQQQRQQCQVAEVQWVHMLDTEKTRKLQQYNDKGSKAGANQPF